MNMVKFALAESILKTRLTHEKTLRYANESVENKLDRVIGSIYSAVRML